jgi:hypothetical protein
MELRASWFLSASVSERNWQKSRGNRRTRPGRRDCCRSDQRSATSPAGRRERLKRDRPAAETMAMVGRGPWQRRQRGTIVRNFDVVQMPATMGFSLQSVVGDDSAKSLPNAGPGCAGRLHRDMVPAWIAGSVWVPGRRPQPCEPARPPLAQNKGNRRSTCKQTGRQGHTRKNGEGRMVAKLSGCVRSACNRPSLHCRLARRVQPSGAAVSSRNDPGSLTGRPGQPGCGRA